MTRVSLAPHRDRAPPPAAAADDMALLARGGAGVVLGCRPAALPAPLLPAADTLFGPRGACLVGAAGPLAVCDTGHHRVLVWQQRPEADGTPADLVIGQPDFAAEGRNARGPVGPASFNVPTGIAAAGGLLAVADAWNHRVLLWHGPPTRSNQPADVVLGQPDFVSADPNRGADAPRADTLNWCCGVGLSGGRLLVADTGNRRVLIWHRIPTRNGAPADLVLGQPGFGVRDENAGGGDAAVGMRWPHAVTAIGQRILVADAGKHRIMAWNAMPERDGAPCDVVLGRADATHAAGAGLNQPYGIARLGDRLVAADTANSRLLGFPLAGLATGAAADRVAGQPSFADRHEAGWAPASRDRLSWPFGVAACGATLVVADTGNNRVLLWEAA